jgi:hypothetical protein
MQPVSDMKSCSGITPRSLRQLSGAIFGHYGARVCITGRTLARRSFSVVQWDNSGAQESPYRGGVPAKANWHHGLFAPGLPSAFTAQTRQRNATPPDFAISM